MKKILDFFTLNNILYKTDVSLKEISSFKIGGIAKIICFPDTVDKVCKTVKFCKENSIKYMPFGKCSNVVFNDNGIDYVLIKTDYLDKIDFNNGQFYFQSGVMLAKASKYTIDNGYEGMEFAYGIPGSVGGAVFMNAGAYGGQMSDCVIETEYVDDSGNVCVLDERLHDFGYRHSYFSDKNYIITSTVLSLKKGDRQKSEELVREYQNARKTKQPLELPSAGSVFKRPEGYFAGKLIQDCDLKGFKVGGAQVSEKHSGFIVNIGDATSVDVKNLVDFIKKTVKQKFNVELECELKFID